MFLRTLFFCAATALLVGCGGSNSSSDPTSNNPPPGPADTASANDDLFTVQQDSADNVLDVLDNDTGSE